jgi:hypothetical protein
MDQTKSTTETPDHQIESLKTSMHYQCRVMLDFALKNGKEVDATQVSVVEHSPAKTNIQAIVGAYNYLADLVKPALPGTLIMFDKSKKEKSALSILGPLPIVRHFMLLSILSLIALIMTSLSGQVNIESIQMSMLQGEGWSQVLRFMFLLAAGSVGASFYALFEMNNYISSGTFDTKYASTYWSRFVLGLVAGILLSELFVVFIEPSQETQDSGAPLASAAYLLKPILAILGGFSASLVYRILNRLISAVESIFTGSADQMIEQKKQEFDLINQASEQKLKTASAQNLLNLKATLIKSNVPQTVLDQIDQALAQVISAAAPLVNNPPSND